MTVESTIKILEVNGVEITPIIGDSVPKLKVKSHWNNKCVVILEFEGKVITVCVNELERAITNATNTPAY